jgi:dihydrofolate synthase/folylpolyglutamate synthase
MNPPPARPELPTDEPFFRERSQRSIGERRSLDRALLLAERLDLTLSDLHPLVVVGSKGKGTTATYAGAALHAAGLSVGLITSPGYRSHHERIRLNGESISDGELRRLARRVAHALDRLPARSGRSGYVSPTGAFTIAGLSWLRHQGCDALVVEAGMGGASDESSLTRPSVVAIASIFEEHLGILGDTLVEVARDKAGTISASTQAVVSAPQDTPVRRVIEDVARRHGSRLAFLPAIDDGEPRPGLRKLPTRLMRTNAHLGMCAAQAYLGVLGHSATSAEPSIPDVLLPGRLSVHHKEGQTWVIDSAISARGVSAALAWCRRALGEPSTVLLSIPDSKDLAACLGALEGTTVRPVRVDVSHLTFTAPDGHVVLPTLDEIDHRQLGDLVLAVGTISFVGEALDLLDVEMSRLF